MPAIPQAMLAPPQIQTAEKPKLQFENAAPPAGPTPGRSRIPLPNTSVQGALHDVAREGSGGAVVVGDPVASTSGYGGITQAPTGGVQASNLELKSDASGVDFRPYLIQILQTIRRNWNAVMPEVVTKLGRRGKVTLQFYIEKNGLVSKIVFETHAGTDALDRAAVAGVSASNPLPALPPEFKGEHVLIRMNFTYNVPRQ
jgi:TonB family protein